MSLIHRQIKLVFERVHTTCEGVERKQKRESVLKP